MILLILIQLATAAFLAYLWIHRKYNYWTRLGVDGPKPSLLGFGNSAQIQGQDPLKVELELRQKHGKVYGHYLGLQPVLTVSDPTLIRTVLIKDFPVFLNRRSLNTFHPMINNTLLFSESEAWKRMRQITSPNFTTGKLKRFTPLMNQCIEKLERYFDQLTEKDSDGGVMENTRLTIMGFTIETIAATMFSTATNSNEARADRTATGSLNAFVENGIKISDISPFQALSYFAMPRWFNRLVNVRHPFNDEGTEFYTNATKAIITGYKKQKGGSNAPLNMVQLLVKAAQESQFDSEASYDGLTASMDTEFKESSTLSNKVASTGKSSISETEMVGVAAGIFLAGFDTMSAVTSSALYELALDEDIQERLFQELSANLDSLDPDCDEYLETVMRLPYFDSVIKETLRKYPVLARLERRVNVEKYNLGDQKIPLVKDQLVEVSVVAVHYDPDFYPEPFRFNPERFAPENKHLLVPYSFIPFGDGPRNCLGMRFAYQEIKLCLSRILRRYRFQPTDDTPREVTFLPFKFVLNQPPYPLRVTKRC